MWRPIQVKRAAKVSDGAGGYSTTYQPLLSTVAEIENVKASVQVESGQYRTVIKTVARMRKRGGYVPKKDDLITWQGVDYSIGVITPVNPPQYDKTELTLYRLDGQD